MEWSEQLSSGLLKAAPDAIVVTDADGRIVLVNAQAERLFGYGGAELLGEPVEVLVPAGVRDRHPRHRRNYMSGPHPRPLGSLALPARHRDGHEFPSEISLSAVRTDEGRFVVAVVRDVSERQRAAQAQALLASIVQSSHDAIVSLSLDGRIMSWNPGAERLYGYRAEEVVGTPVDLLVPADRRGDEREVIALVAAGGRLDRYRAERVRRDGTLVTVSLTVSPLQDVAGKIVGVTSMARDFGERERAEARFQALLEAAPDALVGVDGRGRVVLVNEQAERSFRYAREDLLGQPVRLVLPAGLPGCAGVPGGAQPGGAGVPGGAAVPGTVAASAPGVPPGDPADRPAGPAAPPPGRVVSSAGPVQARRRDGSTFPADIALSALATDDGVVTVVAVRDVTDRLRAEAEQLQLRAEAEQQRLEAHLHRTRRLESLGQLAGGVAHDFNNLLGVIVNYAAFVVEEASAERPDVAAIADDAKQILRAGQRGTDLTHQLLAFARREVIRPRVLDLRRSIADVEQMLRRAIGEHISLRTSLAPDVAPVTADPGQLEQVLVNLAVNARDAMPSGGRLSIEADNVDLGTHQPMGADGAPGPTPGAPPGGLPAGEYVRIRVADSGTGMPPEVIERAFEPFFTTKPSGEGTGLGLATVYGIVTQAGGTVGIESEPGAGTTVTVLLPATRAPVDAVAEEPGRAAAGGGETVLVVEDEDALREVTVRILEGAGYRVLSAEDGARALELLAGHDGDLDLLVTDVVMPGMLGKELAERLVAARPKVKVLFMSGYARPVLASQGTLAPGVVLLEKPFSSVELLSAVRQRLDGD